MRGTGSVAVLTLFLAGCAAPAIDAPSRSPFADALLRRVESAGAVGRGRTAPGSHRPSPAEVSTPRQRTAVEERRGLLRLPETRVRELETIAASDAELDRLLSSPLTRDELAALAVVRSPDIRRARAGYNAARTSYAQSRDLGDLVALYRSFALDLATRIGPERSRVPTAAVAPAPNVNFLSAELAHRTAEIAFEKLRVTVRDVVARAWRAHADAVRLDEARAVLGQEIDLDTALLEAMRGRLESGHGSQSGYLGFRSRVLAMRTELGILDTQETVVRAGWNRLLARPESAPLSLASSTTAPVFDDVDGASAGALAFGERQELRAAERAVERAAIAIRIAETMAFPRMDAGGSRFERERVREAGPDRGPVFPDPGRMVMPRSDFGVREAQVGEMRLKADSARAARDALADQVAEEVRRAVFGFDAAERRVRLHEDKLVPLSQDAAESVRGAYEGSRGNYLDLLDAVRRSLDARLGLADARREAVHAGADLLQAVGVIGGPRPSRSTENHRRR